MLQAGDPGLTSGHERTELRMSALLTQCPGALAATAAAERMDSPGLGHQPRLWIAHNHTREAEGEHTLARVRPWLRALGHPSGEMKRRKPGRQGWTLLALAVMSVLLG